MSRPDRGGRCRNLFCICLREHKNKKGVKILKQIKYVEQLMSQAVASQMEWTWWCAVHLEEIFTLRVKRGIWTDALAVPAGRVGCCVTQKHVHLPSVRHRSGAFSIKPWFCWRCTMYATMGNKETKW